jgi:hypothetical protein
MTSEIALRSVASAEPLQGPSRLARAEVLDAPIPAPVGPALANPRLRLDGSLGLVVLEFRDDAGKPVNSIPTPREIAAYRAAALTDAPMPVGLAPRSAGTPPAPREPVPVFDRAGTPGEPSDPRERAATAVPEAPGSRPVAPTPAIARPAAPAPATIGAPARGSPGMPASLPAMAAFSPPPQAASLV